MIGRTVGHYRILERLGGGGMGVVYKAEDTKLDRVVALKFLPPELTRDDIAKKRFLVEARAAAKLDHPNICTVHEIGESEDGQTFIAMAYYDGESLAARLERGPLAIEEAARIATEVARGLGAAHEAGIIHRDIKPANVMLTGKGEVKIVDFGIAKLGGATGTGSRSSPGTLAYMAPEQVRGEPVTPATDLWSLGAVLYEMVTGRRAFGGEYAQAVAYAIVNEAHAPLEGTLPERPPALDAVIEKALRKDPAKRFQTGAGFVEGLAGVTGDRIAKPVLLRGWTRRRISLVAVLLLSIAVAVTSWVYTARQASTEPSASARPVSAPAAAPAATRTLDPTQVVIAPFENRTGDASLDLVGRNASEWITDELTRIEIRVLSREYLAGVTKTLQSEGTDGDELGIALAEATGSGLLVTGDYSFSGSELTIRAKVIDVSSRSVLDVLEPAKGQRSDPNAVVEAAGRGIRDALAIRLLGPEWMRLGTSPLESSQPPRYEAYVETILAMEASERSSGNYREALVHAKKAVELDPDYVDAWVMISQLHFYLNELKESKEALNEAESRRASLSPVGRLALDGWRATLYRQQDRALTISREWVRRMPGDFSAQWTLMNALIETGRARETLQVFDRSNGWLLANASTRESRVHGYRTLTQALAILGDHERELTEARKCRQDLPSEIQCRTLEARALAALGRLDELDRFIDETLREQGDAETAWAVPPPAARVLRARGRREEALAMTTRAISAIRGLPPERQQALRFNLGLLLYEAGQLEEADVICRALAKEDAGNPRELTDLGTLGMIAAARGDRSRALKISGDLERLRDEHDPGRVSYLRARIAAQLGDREDAVAWMEKAFSQGYSGWPSFYQITLSDSAAFDSLRGYPPFEAMLKSKD